MTTAKKLTPAPVKALVKLAIGDYGPVPNKLKFLGRGAFFIQIGAHYGLDDPVRKLALRQKWNGILVEPAAHLFSRLKHNYGHHASLKLLNFAVGERDGAMPFYWVSDAGRDVLDLPSWFDGTGSFDRSHIVKHFGAAVEPYIQTRDVRCVTLSTFLAEQGVRKIDLLQIDTEGFDYRILKQLDFLRFRPRAILYEHNHLNPEELAGARMLLQREGYRLSEHWLDTLAILDGAAPRGGITS